MSGQSGHFRADQLRGGGFNFIGFNYFQSQFIQLFQVLWKQEVRGVLEPSTKHVDHLVGHQAHHHGHRVHSRQHPRQGKTLILPNFQFLREKKLALNYFFSSSSSIGWEKGLIFLTHCFLNERLNFCLKTKTKSFFHTPEKNFQNPTCDKQKWQKE